MGAIKYWRLSQNKKLHISKPEKYFLDEKIEFDDFSKLKKEYNEILSQLNRQLNSVTQKLVCHDHNNNLWPDTNFNILRSYSEQDINGKHDIINLFTPTSINPATINIDSLKINEVISLIVECRKWDLTYTSLNSICLIIFKS